MWIEVDQPARMNLLGLVLSRALEQKLSDPARRARLEGLEAILVIDAQGMAATLSFGRLGEGRVWLCRSWGCPMPKIPPSRVISALFCAAIRRLGTPRLVVEWARRLPY